MNAKKIILTLLLLSVVGWLGYLVSGQMEKVTKDIYIGFSGEARSNSLFAARLFLKRMGIPAEKVDVYELENLPSIDTVIIINTYRSSLTEERIKKILAWVERGGHLVTVIGDVYDEDDPDILQSILDVRSEDTRYLKNEFFNQKDDKDDSEFDPRAEITLKGLDKKYILNVKYIDPIKTNNEADEKVLVKGVVYLINRVYGEGLITISSDLNFAENRNIEDEDHAELFWQIVHFKHKHIGNVWLLNSDDVPALSSWLWNYAWQLILTLIVFLGLWLYSLSPRLGPIIPNKELNRRRLLEHIQASGHFFWNKDQQDKLIESSQQSVLQKMSTLFPAWHQLGVDEQIKLVSEYSGLPAEELGPLLYSSKQRSMDEFIHLVQQLEMIRKI